MSVYLAVCDLGETNGHCDSYCDVGAASVCRHATTLEAIKVSVSLSASSSILADQV